MSIKSKDLTFSPATPAFLTRLRANMTASNPDGRHERPAARPKRLQKNEDEDAPAYLDENGAEMTKTEYEALMSGTAVEDGEGSKGTEPVEDVGASVTGELKGAGHDVAVSGALPEDESKPKKQTARQVVDAGIATKKRKIGKVVGEGAGEEDADGVVKDGAERGTETDAKAEAKKGAPAAAKKAKRKGKAVKLSFEDEV